MRSVLFTILFLSLLLTTSSVGYAETAYSLRYRITISVETPEGLITGSAVRETAIPLYGGFPHLKGDAVAVDLGKRGVLFALNDVDSGYGVSYMALCDIPAFHDQKTPVGTKWTLSPGDYPRLVTFNDLKDPMTMKPVLVVNGNGYCGEKGVWSVKADYFEEYFGKGVKLKEITLEKTNDPITTGIEKWLSWVPCISQPKKPIETMLKNWQLRDARQQYLPGQEMNSLLFEGLVNWQEQQKRNIDCSLFWGREDDSDRAHFQAEIKKWQPLADQGNAEAQFKIGNLVRYGDGHEILQNPVEALGWYRMSAEQGYQDAQAKLEHIYQFGENVPKDYQEAYFWASLIAQRPKERSPSDDIYVLGWLSKQVTPEQKGVVEKRLRGWKPSTTASDANSTPDRASLTKELLEAVHEGTVEIVKMLIERGADINGKNAGGVTPLMLATMRGDKELVSLLIDKGADVNAKSSSNWTALFIAASHGYTEIAKMLLDKGIDVNIKDRDWGRTAQSQAEINHHPDTAALIAKYAKEQKP